MSRVQMSLVGPNNQALCSELDVLQRMLLFAGARVLELGCGAAEKTRLIAQSTAIESITAVEIDPIQHHKNLKVTDLPKVVFKSYGAELIDEADETFDIVLMFKSLHHVPAESMDDAMKEVARVLKPGGMAYFSEPVFAGDLNEVIRLFHDEEDIRRRAFEAIERAVKSQLFALSEEYFFHNQVRMKSFEQFENGVLNVTHTDHRLSDDLFREVKARFLAFESDDGFYFKVPNRVDLLQKIA